MTHKTIQERIQLRKLIIKTARTLFNQRGYDRTTLNQICHSLCIEKEHLLPLFRSKSELLEAVWSEP